MLNFLNSVFLCLVSCASVLAFRASVLNQFLQPQLLGVQPQPPPLYKGRDSPNLAEESLPIPKREYCFVRCGLLQAGQTTWSSLPTSFSNEFSHSSQMYSYIGIETSKQNYMSFSDHSQEVSTFHNSRRDVRNLRFTTVSDFLLFDSLMAYELLQL